MDLGKKHSATLALIDVVDNMYEDLDNNRTVVGIFLDLQKTIDSILLHKLSNYGVRFMAYEWFRSHLSNRKQFTVLLQVLIP